MADFKIGDYLKTRGEIYWIYVGNNIWLSEKVLYRLPFNDDIEDNDWHQSSLKKFLNSTFKDTFQLEKYTDEIFLLSEQEFGNIDEEFRIGYYCGHPCSYLLRTACISCECCIYDVDINGNISHCNSKYCHDKGVRPAFKLHLKPNTCIIGDGTREDPYICLFNCNFLNCITFPPDMTVI